MYVLNNEAVRSDRGIMNYLPKAIRRYMFNVDISDAYEMHLGAGKPFCIYYMDGCYYLNQSGGLTRIPQRALSVTRAQIDEALELISESSLYSFSDEMCQGYITVRGGHRIGISGSAVKENGSVSRIKNISSLNYRIANEVLGAGDNVIKAIYEGQSVKNTLIISPPGGGKTTMLRDIIRQLSYMGIRISVVDERHEIAAMYDGRSCFDLGCCTDVLDGADKSEGMLMMLRSMSPRVIAADEIGTCEDAAAVKKIINSGVKIITTVHGHSREKIKNRPDISQISDEFDVIITLSSRQGAGTIEEIYKKQ